MDWIIANKDWLFSGVAIALPLGLIGLFVAVLGLFVSSKKISKYKKVAITQTTYRSEET